MTLLTHCHQVIVRLHALEGFLKFHNTLRFSLLLVLLLLLLEDAGDVCRSCCVLLLLIATSTTGLLAGCKQINA